jgi:integrase
MTVDVYITEMSGRWSPETIDRYRRILDQLTADVDVGSLTADELRAWLDRRRWGSSMRYLAISCIKGYIKWQYGQHPVLMVREKRLPSPPQRALKPGEIAKLIESFQLSSVKGVRDLAMCCLMLDTGLRVSEVCRLEMRFLDLDASTLKVLVKGRKWGSAMYSASTARFVNNWLANRPGGSAWVFVSLGGNTPGQKFTRSGLQKTINRWGTTAGIGALSPHDLRRTFAVQATRLGAPSRLVQLAGRWSSIEMVELYTRTLDVGDFERYFPVSGLGY